MATVLLKGTTLKIVVYASVLTLVAGGVFGTSAVYGGGVAPTDVPSGRGAIDLKAMASFDEGMDALSDAFRITLIAEDVPLQQTLDSEKRKELSTLPWDTADVGVCLARFAEQYDYEVATYNTGCYLLRKKFTSPDDMACVTLKEWQASLENIGGLMRPFSPNIENDMLFENPIWRGLVDSLSPDQVTRMATEKGLPISSLSAEQQNRFRTICFYIYIQSPLTKIQEFKEQADLAIGSETMVGWFVRTNKKGEDRRFGFGDPARIAMRQPNSLVAFLGAGVASDVFTPDLGADKADAVPLQTKATPAPRKKIRPVTLGQIAADLTVADANNGDKRRIFRVAAALSEKTVVLSGKRYSRPETCFRAVASAYGLNVRYIPKDGTYTMDRNRPSPVGDVARLQAATLAALPAPFLRRMQIHPDGTYIGGTDPLIPGTPRAEPEREWRTASVRRLRTKVESATDKGINQTVAMASLGAEETVVTNALMAGAGDVLRSRARATVPPYLRDFDSVVLKGGPNKKVEVDFFEIGAHIPRANGTLSPFFVLNVRRQPLDKTALNPTGPVIK